MEHTAPSKAEFFIKYSGFNQVLSTITTSEGPIINKKNFNL
jgi:hypothetical protein